MAQPMPWWAIVRCCWHASECAWSAVHSEKDSVRYQFLCYHALCWSNNCALYAPSAFIFAGLNGCAVDTVSASVGTTFTVPFIVFDKHMPASMVSINKTITVVSRCPNTDQFCPGFLPECAKALPCSLRSLPDEEQAVEVPELRLDLAAVPTGSVSIAKQTLTIYTVCGYPSPADLRVCRQEWNGTTAGHGCVIFAPADASAYVIRPRPCLFDDVIHGRCGSCSVAAVSQGECGATSQEYTYLLGASQDRQISVVVSAARALAKVSFTIYLEVHLNGLSSMHSFVNGTVAGSPLVAALQSTLWEYMSASPSCSLSALQVADDGASWVLFTSSDWQPSFSATQMVGVDVQVAVGLWTGIGANDVRVNGTAMAHCLKSTVLDSVTIDRVAKALAVIGSSVNLVSLTTANESIATQRVACADLSSEMWLNLWVEDTTEALRNSMALLHAELSQVQQILLFSPSRALCIWS
jgi:hypothetical protein